MTTSTIERPQAGAAAPAVSAFALKEKVVLLLLTVRAPGNSRSIRDKSILATNADKERVRLSKRLIECQEYRDISILDNQMRRWVFARALPSPFKNGTHIIALGILDAVDRGLCDFAARRQALVEQLVTMYDAAKADAQAKLGDLYCEDEYMTQDELRAAYSLTWQYVTLTEPDQMEQLNQEIFERERGRLQAQWDDAIGDMRGALRVGLAELVDDMVGRLSDDKKFKPTKLLGRFEEFLATFDARNVTNDADLAAVAQQARALLTGVDAETIKATDVRERVRAGFAAAKDTLATLEVGAKKQRLITFDDE
jgi:hypothetical protein